MVTIHISIFATGIGLLLSSCAVCSAVGLNELVKNRTILCFGDSLTHGMYTNFSSITDSHGHHPYMVALRRHFDRRDVDVVEHGVDGEGVVSMIDRLPLILSSYDPYNGNGIPHDDIANGRDRTGRIAAIRSHYIQKRAASQLLPVFVIILAGTNDISFQEPEVISKNIIQLHAITQTYALRWSTSIYSVAVSIPELNDGIGGARKLFRDTWNDKRELINRNVREYASKHHDHMSYVDINPHFRDGNGRIDQKYRSTDLLHFSAIGYDLMGDVLYEHLKAYADSL